MLLMNLFIMFTILPDLTINLKAMEGGEATEREAMRRVYVEIKKKYSATN